MATEDFEAWMTYALIGGLVAFMAFIIWDLAKRSGAGRLGTLILFIALGLGMLGFLLKTLWVEATG